MKKDLKHLLEHITEAWEWLSIGRIKKGLKSLEEAKKLAERLVEEI